MKESAYQLRQRQLKMGAKVESEHTTNKKVARAIASQHLAEIPNYYDRLIPAERLWQKAWNKAHGTGRFGKPARKLVMDK